MKTLPTALLLAALCACDSAPPPPLIPGKFNGVELPGRPAQAKASGFVDCRPSYSAITCARSQPFDFLGVTPREAALNLTGRDAFSVERATAKDQTGDVRLLPPELLTYDSIDLTFEPPRYDENCVKRAREKGGYTLEEPVSCLTSQHSVRNLRTVLEQRAWMVIASRAAYTTFAHPAESVSITIRRETATLQRIDAAERDAAIKYRKEREATAAEAERAGQKFVSDMAR